MSSFDLLHGLRLLPCLISSEGLLPHKLDPELSVYPVTMHVTLLSLISLSLYSLILYTLSTCSNV